MRIINLSLSTAVVPDALKVDMLSPTLKKIDADFEQFQNFRPISNLKVVSKLVEKAVAIQLTHCGSRIPFSQPYIRGNVHIKSFRHLR